MSFLNRAHPPLWHCSPLSRTRGCLCCHLCCLRVRCHCSGLPDRKMPQHGHIRHRCFFQAGRYFSKRSCTDQYNIWASYPCFFFLYHQTCEALTSRSRSVIKVRKERIQLIRTKQGLASELSSCCEIKRGSKVKSFLSELNRLLVHFICCSFCAARKKNCAKMPNESVKTNESREQVNTPAERVEGEVLPGSCRYFCRALDIVVALLCLRHFFTLHRRSDFLSPLMSISVEPSFFRNFFSTYFALIQASFSCLRRNTTLDLNA